MQTLALSSLPAHFAESLACVIATDALLYGAQLALGTGESKLVRNIYSRSPMLGTSAVSASVAAAVLAASFVVDGALTPLLQLGAAYAAASTCLALVCATLPLGLASATVSDRSDVAACWSFETIRSVLELAGRVAIGMVVIGMPQMVNPLHRGAVAGVGGVALTVAFQAVLSHVDGPAKADHPVNTDKDKVWREEEGVSVLVQRVFWSKSRVTKARKDITMAEVATHCKRDNAWICVEGRAYDVTKYVESHPGGWLPIANLAGKDVSDAFANYHPARVYEKLLPSFYIGDIVDYKVPAFVLEHRAQRQELLRRNRFETKPSFYVVMCLWYAALFSGAVALTVLGRGVADRMAGAVLLATFWQQVAFFGHDIGHNAVSHVRQLDQWWGALVGNITGGISLAWWKRSHNVHHVVCNSIENDPDIQHMPALAVDKEIFGKFESSFHRRWVETDDVARALVSWQHVLYYPLMAVARFNLYAQSYILLFSGEAMDNKTLEGVTLLGFLGFLGGMVSCTQSWQEALAYLLVSHGLAGLLHVQITLSHFAEPVYHGQAYNDEDDEWFKMQVRTSLNVDCPPFMDWFHGGLQFQVEHHLYPRLPRHNLRECRDEVKALCAKHAIEYKELPFLEGCARVLAKLEETALEARKLTKGDGGFYHSAIHHGLNALG